MKYTLYAPLVLGALLVALAFFYQGGEAPVGGFGNQTLASASTTAYTITSSAEVLSTTTNRGVAVLCNDSSNVVYLKFSDQPFSSNPGEGVRVSSNTCYTIDDSVPYTGAVQATSTNESSSQLFVNEFVF